MIKEFIKKIKWRWNVYNNFHIVRLNLPRGYYDADTRILYACFGIFKEFYEMERNTVDLPEICDIMDQLYRYWTIEYKSCFIADTSEEEERLYRRENEMLNLLISIRAHLWD